MIDLVVRERREAFKGEFIIPEVVYHKPTLSDIKAWLADQGMIMLKKDMMDIAYRCCLCHAVYLDEPVTVCDCDSNATKFYQAWVLSGFGKPLISAQEVE